MKYYLQIEEEKEYSVVSEKLQKFGLYQEEPDEEVYPFLEALKAGDKEITLLICYFVRGDEETSLMKYPLGTVFFIRSESVFSLIHLEMPAVSMKIGNRMVSVIETEELMEEFIQYIQKILRFRKKTMTKKLFSIIPYYSCPSYYKLMKEFQKRSGCEKPYNIMKENEQKIIKIFQERYPEERER